MRLFLLAFLALSSAVTSREDLRFRWSGEQGFDESCGLAALATLLSTYHGRPADEVSLARELGLGSGAIPRVSLADLVALLETRGFVAEAWEVRYEELCRLAGLYPPLLVHYARPVGHFALVLQADEGGAVVADPSTGLALVEPDLFLWLWSGRVLLAEPERRDGEVARRVHEAVGEVESSHRLGELVARDCAALRVHGGGRQ